MILLNYKTGVSVKKYCEGIETVPLNHVLSVHGKTQWVVPTQACEADQSEQSGFSGWGF